MRAKSTGDRIRRIVLSIVFLSSLSYGRTIAFLEPLDKTIEGQGKEEVNLIITTLFPNEGFNLIPREKVNRVLTPAIQKSLGTITPEMAWTICELLECDVIGISSIEGAFGKRLIRFSFIEGGREKDPNLKEYLLDAFSSHFGINTKIEKLISQSSLVIPLAKEDGVKIGMRFDIIRSGIKIGEAEVTSIEPKRSILSVSHSKEKITPFDLIRKSGIEIAKTKEFLIINTKPKTDISWKGNKIGESPIIINDKIGGWLSVEAPGFTTSNVEIENKSHPYSFLDITLYLATLKGEEKMPSSLAVSSIPDNCEVFIDGRLVGITPLFIPNLEEKVYSVVVKKEGFSPQTQRVLVKGEQELRVNLYPLSLPEEREIPKEKKGYLSELISLPTSNVLKENELLLGITYPDIFLLKAGLPSLLKAEISVFGIGGGLKYSLINWLGISLYYKAYDMRNKERRKDKGFWAVSSLPSKFFNIHLGLGYLWKENSSSFQYFLGIDKAIKGVNLLAEYQKDRFAFGIHKPLGFFEVKYGMTREGKETTFNIGVYIKRKPIK